ncbi:hypothetical protein [Paenibacillus xanthanilyticus]|uniref:Uncharacterized protein n=1 Tax=Paenibacillus xanthanilyticus TaxID=1783531 RepID=A0ABV8KDI1_9BACL
MRKQPLKWGIVGGMIVLMVMFGIDVATSGVERIYGPVEQQEATPIASQGPSRAEYPALQPETETGYHPRQTAQEQDAPVYRPTVAEAQRHPERAAERYTEMTQVENERLPGIPDLRDDTTVDKLADGTAGALQSLSSQGIRFVVSLFESVTD